MPSCGLERERSAQGNVALFKGSEPKVNGQYYLRFTEHGNRRFEIVDGEASDAVAAAQKKEATPKAKAAGVAIVKDSKPNDIKLADAIAEHKAEIKDHKAWSTHRAYSTALNLFVKGGKKTYVDDVNRDCIMSFSASLKKAAFTGRSVFTRFGYVHTFLKRYGKAGLVGKNDWPK